MTAIKLWMTDELLEKLTQEARSTGVPRTSLITYILADWVRKNPPSGQQISTPVFPMEPLHEKLGDVPSS